MIEKLLQFIYPHADSKALLLEIENIKKKHVADIKKNEFSITEKDVMLITYGDQVSTVDEPPIKTLHKFLNSTIKNWINSIHILPFYPYTSDDGFSVQDYVAVNPALGNWENIEEMAQDYNLMFDAVVNHISQESDWFKAYLQDEKEFEDFFIDANPTEDWSKVVRPRTSPLLHTFTAHKEKIRNIWTTFSKDQVDLNYNNPHVLIKVIDVLLTYVAKGATLIRLDAIGFLFKKAGSTCIHLPETHALIKIMRKVIEEVAPQVVIISETNVPHAENISYFGNGTDEAHMVYNFTLPPLLAYSILSGKIETLAKWISSLKLPSSKTYFFNFTASHDGIGVRPLTGILPDEEIKVLTDAAEANEGLISYRSLEDGSKSPYEINCNYLSLLFGVERDESLAIKRMLLAQAVMLSMPGVPSFYFHSLFGSTNDIDGVQKTGMNRSINREKLALDQLTSELNDSRSLRSVLFTGLSELITCRTLQKAFDPAAEFSVLQFQEGILALVRKAKRSEQKLLCIYNFDMEDQKITLPKGTFNDLLSNEFLSGELIIPGYHFHWLEYK